MMKDKPHNQERIIKRKRRGKVMEKGEVKSDSKGTWKEEVETTNRKRHERVTLEKRDIRIRGKNLTGTKICKTIYRTLYTGYSPSAHSYMNII
jgi:hypothetical protein